MYLQFCRRDSSIRKWNHMKPSSYTLQSHMAIENPRTKKKWRISSKNPRKWWMFQVWFSEANAPRSVLRPAVPLCTRATHPLAARNMHQLTVPNSSNFTNQWIWGETSRKPMSFHPQLRLFPIKYPFNKILGKAHARDLVKSLVKSISTPGCCKD